MNNENDYIHIDNIDTTSTKEKLTIGSLKYQHPIFVPADFPTNAEVQAGWCHEIAENVTDNDSTKTNTGQSFLAPAKIICWLYLQLEEDKIMVTETDYLNMKFEKRKKLTMKNRILKKIAGIFVLLFMLTLLMTMVGLKSASLLMILTAAFIFACGVILILGLFYLAISLLCD